MDRSEDSGSEQGRGARGLDWSGVVIRKSNSRVLSIRR